VDDKGNVLSAFTDINEPRHLYMALDMTGPLTYNPVKYLNTSLSS